MSTKRYSHALNPLTISVFRFANFFFAVPQLFYRIAVVTGGNKGIGLEICRQLADQVVVVLTARDHKLGEDAVAKLHESGLRDVIFNQLDVTDPTSIASLANFIDAQFGKLDILVFLSFSIISLSRYSFLKIGDM